MQVNAATVADIPALSDLLSLLFAQEAEFRPDPAAQQRGLAAIINDPAVGTILVARDGGAVLGMVNLLFTVSTALGTRVALLEDMVVTTRDRNRGVGAELLRTAIVFARDHGCRRITLLTDADNVRAQAFYRTEGFAMSSMVPLRLALD